MTTALNRFCLKALLTILSICTPLQWTAGQSVRPVSESGIQSLIGVGQLPWLHSSDLRNEQAELLTLYRARNFVHLWFRSEPFNTQATAQAMKLLDVLHNAADYGLRAADYDGAMLTERLTQLSGISNARQVQNERDQLDLGLSVAALRLIRHLHFGRIDPNQAGFEFNASRAKEIGLAATLGELAASKDLKLSLSNIEPRFAHYQLLKAALLRYRTLAMNPALTQLPGFTARSIKPGESYAGVAALRKLLVAEQDMKPEDAAPDSGATLDAATVNALKAYQTRHGLTPDGVLGKQTFAALTTPLTKRVQQIELTLERWRWIPPLRSPMIVVNIPQFKLFAFKADDDREANLLRMDVIVGQAFPHTRTPVFLADMTHVIFRPYWDVPYNITRRELLPVIQRNPAYLQKNHFELVNGQGDRSPVVPATPDNIAQLATGKIRMRQLPGGDNALGDIKFMLPNEHNVYLHSTPAKQLFAQSRRAFSHGCIRVSDPAGLAEYVLRYAQGDWSRDKIETAMQGDDRQGEANQRVNLNQPIPVMIVYGTAMPLESGVVQFFDDIYGYDARLAKLL